MATVATGTRTLQKSRFFFSKMALLKVKNPESIVTYLLFYSF
jgi:hypothetical protein